MFLSPSNRKYPPFPLFSYFFHGYVPEMFVTSYSVTYCIYIPGKLGIGFISIVQFLMSTNSRIRFGLHIVFVCWCITPSHYHHCETLSEDIERIKCLSDIICRVCKIKHFFSVFHYTICGAVCFQFTHFICDNWEKIYICLSIIIKSEVWTTTHCLGLGHETMLCAVCLSIFL